MSEGTFKSAFDQAPEKAQAEDSAAADAHAALVSDTRLASSVQKAAVFVAATSKITSGAILFDDTGSQPTAVFVRNVLDYLEGREELCYMRSKGLSQNVLNKADAVSAAIAKLFNQYVLPLSVVVAGFIGRHARKRRKRLIQKRYAHHFDEQEAR